MLSSRRCNLLNGWLCNSGVFGVDDRDGVDVPESDDLYRAVDLGRPQ